MLKICCYYRTDSDQQFPEESCSTTGGIIGREGNQPGGCGVRDGESEERIWGEREGVCSQDSTAGGGADDRKRRSKRAQKTGQSWGTSQKLKKNI